MGYFKSLDGLSSSVFVCVGIGVMLLTIPYRVQAEPMPVSWYGPGFDGNYTANGEVFDRYAHTAAHPSWPFGTLVQLTNYTTGAVVIVRINDRSGGVLDLSEQAARDLGTYRAGVASVDVEIVRWGTE
ncbi:Rare lipoprotein A-like double-psi beta-barrel [Synechococcus sp. PCC 7335]|uniref:septal ring lytic transglycosylase RlpA family protein n=1 Tax=Synechococcus sp. (strain ATCC 29403 / PCC 7335) TaxID=91464 RepID=UPI00017EC75C|nr:septal ring lytic transglycosylase RlpA family protein [Synechococcus sp. PCC 7335]EDX83931.1 Rare lipoprotein A-like double-psi beta-barrel [Synechococcus sp. PCC 7335]